MDWFNKKILPLRECLLKYANGIMQNRDEGEDIVQEVFAKLWYNREVLEKHPNVESLAYVITKNLALNRKKALLRKVQCGTENLIYEEKYPEHDEKKQNTKMIWKIVETLPSLQKWIFTLRHIEGYEFEEISQITGSSPEAVRMNLSRARKKIRDIYIIRRNETDL